MKAHDVRHLCLCPQCGKLGDDREMVHLDAGIFHGECAYKMIGIKGLLELPSEEIGKITIDDVGGLNAVGVSNMRRLCDCVDVRGPSALTFD